MAYGDFEDLPRRAARDKYLGDKPFNIAKSPKYDGYQRRIASMVYSFFEKKKTSGGGFKSIPNQLQLGNELNKPIIRKFIKRKVYSSFKDNIWGGDLAEM